MLAQSPVATPSFALPTSVAKGTTIRLDGSSSLEVTNQQLKQRFETEFPGTTVQLGTQGTDAALKALLAGQIDVAAIGRALTPEEKAQGLVARPIRREKIAIIVGPENPFASDLTFEQFAKIFRGEITNWSQVGGPAGPIRVIDRPELSDTRQAFKAYPVFKTAPFVTGVTAKLVGQDSTVEVINALGKDGIGYAIANQVLNQKSVKIIPMHKTRPDDARYPYSQPLAYVYQSATPSPAAQAFLGWLGAPAGQAAIQAAKAAEMAALATGTVAAASLNAPAASPSAGSSTGAPTVSPSASSAIGTPTGSPTANIPTANVPTANVPTANSTTAGLPSPDPKVDAGLPPWLWLIPLLLGAAGLWWFLKGRRSPDVGLAPNGEMAIPPVAATPAAPPMPPAPAVDASGNLAGAAGLAGSAPDLAAASTPIGTPLTTPEDLGGGADPAVFDLPHPSAIAPNGVPGLGVLAGGAAVVAGAAIAGAAATPPASAETDSSAIAPDSVAPEAAVAAVPDPTAAEGALPPDEMATALGAEPVSPIAGLTPSLGVSAAQMGGAFLAAGVGAAAWATTPAENAPPGIIADLAQTEVEAARFDVGSTQSALDLSDVDSGLRDLPDGYGDSRIVLLPRDPQAAYTYWDTPNDHKDELRRQGGQQLALRLCDVTDIDINQQPPHSMQQYDCDEMARDWHLPIPVSDRDYVAEIGYLTAAGSWLLLARSLPVRIPPVYPSDWFEEKFITIDWHQNLRGQRLITLTPPSQRLSPLAGNTLHEQLFALAGGVESLRVAGSLFGSMQPGPGETVFPSGVGLWALPTPSGMGWSGMGISGIGLAASMPPMRARKFWLVADAELIIYGATEPDATVTIAGRPITLNPDGTFRFQMPFHDGQLDFPIWATAVDGEQNRAIQMKFTRETPARRTNTKDEATDELF